MLLLLLLQLLEARATNARCEISSRCCLSASNISRALVGSVVIIDSGILFFLPRFQLASAFARVNDDRAYKWLEEQVGCHTIEMTILPQMDRPNEIQFWHELSLESRNLVRMYGIEE